MAADPDDLIDTRPQRVRPVRLGALDVLGSRDPGSPDLAAAADVTVTGVTLASADVRPGDLYAALPGARTHGARFAADAIARGAVAVLTDAAGAAILAETADTGADRVAVVTVDDPRSRLGALAAQVYGDPAERLTTFGVTGTQGKTTCTYLAASALAGAGERVGLIGTTGTLVDGTPVASALTTPEAPALHALLAVMAERGVGAVAMEVSSHALALHRADGVVFDVAAFLNLGRDHLDFHTDLEDYFAAKASLFTPEHAARAVVDVDDPYGRRLVEQTTLPVRTVDLAGSAQWSVRTLDEGPRGSTARVVAPGGRELDLVVNLPGRFNVANALVVLASLAEVGYDPEALAAGIAACAGVPGRMERVEAGQRFTAIVDYAHKPDALRAVLDSLRGLSPGRLVLVIGAGGDRDPGKRPLMGAVGAELADVLVVTDDNPRTEDPATIRAAVLAGAAAQDAGTEVVEIGDRAEAIARAVALAGDDDVVVVAGKGHERGQIVGDSVLAFDDRDVLAAAIEDRLGGGR
ncbi:UNVERIFIED_CONTAM: UDP-N-acetylmuramoylalanyl-D-glutamate--2,6-diaminopimelate ligase [Mumia flava]|nr:UDP-N-acetylmuramoyl-L-alanyl-D-glutamate--2,6-diaminopimelate ligase [Mumia flava]